MAWRIVQQPNGLLARFSDIVDCFTHYHMTEAEAVNECLEYMGRRDAADKVKRGIEAGNERFIDSIKTIRVVHGDKEADEWIAVMNSSADNPMTKTDTENE